MASQSIRSRCSYCYEFFRDGEQIKIVKEQKIHEKCWLRQFCSQCSHNSWINIEEDYDVCSQYQDNDGICLQCKHIEFCHKSFEES